METSGEGEINAHSRVQMALGEAKNKAKKEFAEALEKTGLTLDQCRAWVEAHPETQAAAVPGAAPQGRGRHAANFVYHIADAWTAREAELRRSAAYESHMENNFLIGMDVGSTTVKAVVIDAATDEILWSDYQRHDTKQPEKVLEFCKRFETEIEGFRAEPVPHVHHRVGRQRHG